MSERWSTKTVEELEGILLDNLGYQETGSVESAALVRRAADSLLIRYADRLKDEGGKEIERHRDRLNGIRDDADRFVSQNRSDVPRVLDVHMGDVPRW